MKIKDITEGRIEGGVWVDKPGNVPAPSGDPEGASSAPAQKSKAPSKPNSNQMGTIKGGVWTADPPKKGEKGVPVPSPVDENIEDEEIVQESVDRILKLSGLAK